MATSSVQILIGTKDFTNLVPYDSVSVDNNIVMTADTMDFQVVITSGDTVTDTSTGGSVTATRPMCGQEVVWQNPNAVIVAPGGYSKPFREFGGIIVEVQEELLGMSLLYTVNAKSYVHWLDRHLVTKWYNQGAPETIIKQMISDFAPTFTTYNVQGTNTTIIPQYFDYQKMSDSIKLIADQLEYGWYVDNYKDVHFFALESFKSPLRNNTLDVDNDVSSYSDLVLTENAQQQVNKVFIKGFKTRSVDMMIVSYPADSQTTQWSLGYRASSVSGDVDVVVYDSVTQMNGDTQWKNGGKNTAGTHMVLKRDIIDGSPTQNTTANNTAWIHYTQHLLRISNFNSGGAVPTGKVVACRMHYMKDVVWLAQDPQAQAQTSSTEGKTSDGVYEGAYQDKSLTNSTLDAVKAKGQMLLMKYGTPQITGTFNCYFDSTKTSGWNAGQYFNIKTTKRFGGLNEIMFVQRVTKTITKNDSGGLISYYTVEFADSPYLV